MLCDDGLGAVMGVETVADLARFGTDKDCRGELVAETGWEDGQGSASPGPTPELATASTKTLAESDRDENADVLDN